MKFILKSFILVMMIAEHMHYYLKKIWGLIFQAELVT